MKRETFVAILSATLAEADAELLREAEGLVFWRKRELRSEQVQLFKPGMPIEYLAKDGKTNKRGIVDHLNKFSLTVRHPHPTQGFIPEVVPIERVLGIYYTAVLTEPITEAEAAKNQTPETTWRGLTEGEFSLKTGDNQRPDQ